MIKYRIKSIALITVILLIIPTGLSAAVAPSKQIEKFLTAVQKKDFKTIFDMTYHYQEELKEIKSNNPKALWQKLTTEYYESEKAKYVDNKQDDAGLMNFLTPSGKWKVIEVKKETKEYIVYVSFNYKILEESPLIRDEGFAIKSLVSHILKEGILEFTLDAQTGLYKYYTRVEKADVYWDGDPSINLRIVKHLSNLGLEKDSLVMLENLQKKGTLNDEGKLMLTKQYIKEGIVKQGYSRNIGGSNHYEFNQNLDKALSLVSGDASIKQELLKEISPRLSQSLEYLKGSENNFLDSKRDDEIKILRDILEFIIKWNFTLESNDKPLFSDASNYLSSRYEQKFKNIPDKEYERKALFWKERAKEWEGN